MIGFGCCGIDLVVFGCETLHVRTTMATYVAHGLVYVTHLGHGSESGRFGSLLVDVVEVWMRRVEPKSF